MEIVIRKALDEDINVFIEFSVKLSKFNRSNHSIEYKYDDYGLVLNSIRIEAEKAFINRDENTLILIALIDRKPIGYALGKIYEAEKTAANGTGKIGLLDELYVDEVARVSGIGKKLIDEVIRWLRGKGISRIRLQAYSWNKNAKRLYEKYGFKEYAAAYEKHI